MDERIKGTLAEQLRYDRCNRNWSITYLGKLIGSKDALMKYERGVILPTRERSVRLAYIFNTGTKYYYDDYLEGTENFKEIIENAWIRSGLSKRSYCFKLNISYRTLLRWLDTDIPTRTVYQRIKNFI